MHLEPILQVADTNKLKQIVDNKTYFEHLTNSRKKGTIFCHVKNTKDRAGVRVNKRGGPQKCIGAKPAFSNKPMQTHLLKSVKRSDTYLVSNSNEPILCTTKYIILVFFREQLEMSGRKDIKFTSIINHAVGHDSVDSLPNVPITMPVHIYYSF